MTEADFKSIWDHADIDDTRWSNIGTRMAEILNFWINEDATSQITSTAVTPILEQLSEEGFRRIKMASKEDKFVDPYNFIMSQIASVMATVIQENFFILTKIQKILGKRKIELVRKTLPSSTSDW